MNMANTSRKTDTELKTDVLSELKYEPGIKIAEIGVWVKDGTVTLNGSVSSYSDKNKAVSAVKRIAGVKAIADDIAIKLMNPMNYTDGDIAASAIMHIDSCTLVPTNSINVTVRHGWITLDGEVEWGYQKNAAANVVKHLSGVKGLFNSVLIKPKLTPSAMSVETAIKSAFTRNALLDANKVQVEIDEGKVILRGNVRNFAELDEAERVAWAAPGVSMVENHLMVNWILAE